MLEAAYEFQNRQYKTAIGFIKAVQRYFPTANSFGFKKDGTFQIAKRKDGITTEIICLKTRVLPNGITQVICP